MKGCQLIRLFALLLGISKAHFVSAAGARLLADLNPGAGGSFPSNFTAFGSQVYFSAYTLETGVELFRSDGNSASLAASINPTADDIGFGQFEGNDSLPDWLTVFNGQLYFSAYEPTRGAELWRYDGTAATRVSDIHSDANNTIKIMPNSSWPRELTVLNDGLYFSATSTINPNNYELWIYDGTSVRQAANIHADFGPDHSSYPTGLKAFNGGLFFMADDGTNGWELFRYNGSTATLININPGGSESSSYPKYFTEFGGLLYFQAYTTTGGFELWKSDGTRATIVADLNAGSTSSSPEYLTVFNGELYFRGSDPVHGAELRRFNGVQISLASDIYAGGDSYPKNLTVLGTELVFAANDGIHGWELWRFDGTSATLITDLNAAGDAFPENLTVHGNGLYFTATTPETGYEIWKYDGSSVTLAADVNAGPGDSFPRFLRSINGELFFSAAANGSTDWEAWVIDESSTPNHPPSVSITAPADGASFQTTDNVTISATATDDGLVSKVEFFANGNLTGEDTTVPYSISTTLAAGTYTLIAKATDNLGASTTSAAVSISVQGSGGNQPPTVTIVSEADGKILVTPATIAMLASATDQDGTISRVEFFRGQESIGFDTSAPFELLLNSVPTGNYLLTAVATDNQGASATSAGIQVRVVDPPVLTAITRSGNTIQVRASGLDDVPLTLETSADFENWLPVAIANSVDGSVTFERPIDGRLQFYRIAIR